MDQFKEIGYTKKTHGVKGGIRIIIENQYLDAFYQASVVFINQKGALLPYFIENIQEGSELIVTFEDINSKEEARNLTGFPIYLSKEDLDAEEPVPEYDDDIETLTFLEGYDLIDKTLGILGPIIRVEEYPQQQMGIIIYNGKEVLIPLHVDLMSEINTDEQKVMMELPEGILEIG